MTTVQAPSRQHRAVTGREFGFATVLEVADGGSDGFLVGWAERAAAPYAHADRGGRRMQLDTGVLRWALRTTLPDGTVAIDPTLEPDPAPGGHLRDVGFDVQPGRAAHAEGRLIQWWQLYLDDTVGPPPTRQLVAQLEHLESKPSVPASSSTSSTWNTASSACHGNLRAAPCA